MLTDKAFLETLTGCLRNAYGMLTDKALLFIFPKNGGPKPSF